jgi:hypothetical protein
MNGGGAQANARHPALRAPRLWGTALAGHVAWSAQLLLSYFVTSLACAAQPGAFRLAGLDGFQALLVALTLVPAAVALLATLDNWRAWRAARRQQPRGTDEAVGWRGFLGLFGLLLNGVFVATILLTGLSLVYLQPCR